MAEFSAFADYRDVVKKLVNNDIGAKDFFESLSSIEGGMRICYYDSLSEAIKHIEKQIEKIKMKSDKKPFIVVTTIPLVGDNDTEEGTHSIFFTYSNDKIYLYDPNGSYDIRDNLAYKHDDIIFANTGDFGKYLKPIFRLPVVLPKGKGIQQVTILPPKSTYINDGGYCMFFNWLLIEKIVRDPKQIHKLITDSPASKNDRQSRQGFYRDVRRAASHSFKLPVKTINKRPTRTTKKGGRRRTVKKTKRRKLRKTVKKRIKSKRR